MEPLDNLELIKDIGKKAHKVYLANWETKTQVAENYGEWNQQIHYQVLGHIEELSRSVTLLCHVVERIVKMNELKTIDQE